MKPEQSRIEQARRVLGAIDDDLLYARIDMIESDGRMLLVEMELIEPTLYFISDPASPVAFVEKVISRFMR